MDDISAKTDLMPFFFMAFSTSTPILGEIMRLTASTLQLHMGIDVCRLRVGRFVAPSLLGHILQARIAHARFVVGTYLHHPSTSLATCDFFRLTMSLAKNMKKCHEIPLMILNSWLLTLIPWNPHWIVSFYLAEPSKNHKNSKLQSTASSSRRTTREAGFASRAAGRIARFLLAVLSATVSLICLSKFCYMHWDGINTPQSVVNFKKALKLKFTKHPTVDASELRHSPVQVENVSYC